MVNDYLRLFFVVMIYAAIALEHLANPAQDDTLASGESSILEERVAAPESQITPGPSIPGVVSHLELKRDTSILCSGYSIVGNTYPCMCFY